jgi:hypothetical protein
VVYRSVTITGTQSGDLSILGTDSTRVIWINENLKNVKISNLNISHGNEKYGGGIYCVGSNLTLNDVSINHSSAIEEGGGIYWGAEHAYQKNKYDPFNYNKYANRNHYHKNQQVINNEKELHLYNVKLTNNHARHGGAIFCYHGNCTIVNTTIFNNFATGGHGGGIYAGPNTIIVNSILWNNYSDQVSDSTVTGSVNILYSDVMKSWPGLGNIDIDPLFADTANGDYQLRSGSPCIDSGVQDTMIIYNDGQDTLIVPPMDYIGSAPDMGAYEYDPSTYIFRETDVPIQYALLQNYPNPFNPSTTIEFTISKSEFTTLKVYNILGKEISTLVSSKLNQGNHIYTFDGRNLASGVYYYRLEAGTFVQTRKMIYLK